MLTAMDESDCKVYADDVYKTDENGNKLKYYCPECGDELILRQGRINIPHFSHKHDTMCLFRKNGGESYVHNHMKHAVKTLVERDNRVKVSDLEHKIGNRIADYYFEVNRYGLKKVAVECVHKHTDADEFDLKNEFYRDNGIYVIWVFDTGRFSENRTFKSEVRTREIMREAHNFHFQRIYCIDILGTGMYAIHFDKVKRWRNGGYDQYGEYHDGYYKTLRNTNGINAVHIPKFRVNAFADKQSDSYIHYDRKVAGTFMDKWW